MTALGMILNSLGIKITDEHRHQIEILIPQIPARVVQAVEAINASIAKVNELTAAVQSLEAKIDSLKKEIDDGRRNHSGSIDRAPEGPGDDAPDSPRYLNGNPTKRKRAGTGTN